MLDLPTGTVTFLFTDVEGSTRLWEQAADAANLALARHDAIIEVLVAQHSGQVVRPRGEGDSRFAVFTRATDAVAAAGAIQRALHDESWPTPVPLRVRMALHTGEADLRAGDYYGPAVNRCARLRAVAHGGQTLLSSATHELVRDRLPQGIDLHDLGTHRLKDLIRPEHVFQLVVVGLPGDFPPLTTLDAHPHNLPLQTTPLIGREAEVASVRERILRPDVRLVTLTGPGGTGKTRLALQTAAELLDAFPDGIWFVNLAPIRLPDLVVSAIADALGVNESGGKRLIETLKERARRMSAVLVLDNFEQVLEAAAVVAELLASAGQLKMLVTSRIPLHIYGEYEFAVPPLALPDPSVLVAGATTHMPVEHLTQYEAVRLFIERAQAAKADFAVTNANAPAVAEICFRLDGLPLAIELAATRVKLLPPEAMLARLTNRLKFLTGGSRNLPARQQTLRGAIDWSYELLDPPEQRLFNRLAVFVGGRTLEAIEVVCDIDGDLELDVLDGLQSLMDKSLLVQERGIDTEPRFVMLETIHEYALEQLEASGESELLRRRHAHYFLEFIQTAEAALSGPEQSTWLDRLEQEHGNFRAALSWSLRAESETALRLAGLLERFWESHCHFTEGRRWLEQVLETSPTAPPALRARALTALGTLAWYQADYRQATIYHQQALELWRQLDDKSGIAFALMALGAQDLQQGAYEQARVLLEQGLVLCRELGDTRVTAFTVHNLGEVARHQGQYPLAEERYAESRSLLEAQGDTVGVAVNLAWLGMVAQLQQHYDAAAAYYRRGLMLARSLGHREFLAICFEGIATLSGASGHPHHAARLYGAAEAVRAAIGAPIPPADRDDYERGVAVARAQLDEGSWSAAWAEGQGMSVQQAADYALDVMN